MRANFHQSSNFDSQGYSKNDTVSSGMPLSLRHTLLGKNFESQKNLLKPKPLQFQQSTNSQAPTVKSSQSIDQEELRETLLTTGVEFKELLNNLDYYVGLSDYVSEKRHWFDSRFQNFSIIFEPVSVSSEIMDELNDFIAEIHHEKSEAQKIKSAWRNVLLKREHLRAYQRMLEEKLGKSDNIGVTSFTQKQRENLAATMKEIDSVNWQNTEEWLGKYPIWESEFMSLRDEIDETLIIDRSDPVFQNYLDYVGEFQLIDGQIETVLGKKFEHLDGIADYLKKNEDESLSKALVRSRMTMNEFDEQFKGGTRKLNESIDHAELQKGGRTKEFYNFIEVITTEIRQQKLCLFSKIEEDNNFIYDANGGEFQFLDKNGYLSEPSQEEKELWEIELTNTKDILMDHFTDCSELVDILVKVRDAAFQEYDRVMADVQNNAKALQALTGVTFDVLIAGLVGTAGNVFRALLGRLFTKQWVVDNFSGGVGKLLTQSFPQVTKGLTSLNINSTEDMSIALTDVLREQRHTCTASINQARTERKFYISPTSLVELNKPRLEAFDLSSKTGNLREDAAEFRKLFEKLLFQTWVQKNPLAFSSTYWSLVRAPILDKLKDLDIPVPEIGWWSDDYATLPR